MLSHLHIRDFAIIERTECEWQSGLTALTGETGAGKSILLDALALVLGGRSSGTSVKQDAERADITASFDIDDLPDVNAWLTEHDLDDEASCLLRRVITRQGKSRGYINGRPVSMQMLGELGRQLIAIHGQHAHQTLNQPTAQRQLLDGLATNDLVATVAQRHGSWQAAARQVDDYTARAAARQQRIDLLQFHLQEFDALDTGGVAFNDIEQEHNWRANAERLQLLIGDALQPLDNETGINQQLVTSQRALDTLVGIDTRLQEALDLIDSAAIQCTEAMRLLQFHAADMEHDQHRLDWLNDRLGLLHGLSKKHHVDIDGLNAVEDGLRRELDELNQSDQGLDALTKERDALHEAYLSDAKKLTRQRKRLAKNMAQSVTASMQLLGMTNGQFVVDITTDSKQIERHGQDTVSFLVAPNAGVDPAPLARVASGGELSRISLGIQLATLAHQHVPTLIFDEVDAGVGGAVAEQVGKLLRQVAGNSQVMVVTHLAQVAAQAHAHKRVQKTTVKGKTLTELEDLDAAATRDEIARMIGGARITRKSRQHAEEMLATAAD